MAEFKRDQHGWYYAGNWLKPIIGLVVFLIVASILFRVIAWVLPIVIIGALIFLGIKFFSQNGAERERWESWAEGWAKQFKRNVTGCSEAAQPPKRKNDEEVLEIEYEEVPAGRDKAKRNTGEVEYL